nr:uncharacterized protein LOC128683259 [Plodia interpunctella]
MEVVLDRLQTRKRAPGPDGVHGKVLALILVHLGEEFRGLLNRCLREGQFPKLWKEGRLCLIPKGSRPLDSASAVRPLVLLSEAGKALESVVASRLVRHVEEGPGPRLSDVQYGFRAKRSTIDALRRLRSVTEEADREGDVTLATSLDVANAFNSIPHSVIREALRYFGVPSYLRRLLGVYLEDRVVLYEDGGGRMRIKAAVAQAGSCTEDQVWVGEIRSDWRGSGSALMRCPVTTAKKLIEAGSLTVGWSRVQLRHLEARPMHCYKCMGKGHTASLCPSQTDRSRLCYRCGETGHLSASCTAEPRCAVCRDAGKPAGHVMGGRACNPPPIRGKGPSPPPREGRQGEAPVGQMEE